MCSGISDPVTTSTFASVVFFTSRQNHSELLSSDLEVVLPKTLNPFHKLPLTYLIHTALCSSISSRSTEQCIYLSLSDPSNQFAKWFTLWIDPNPKKKKKQFLVPIPSPNLPPLSRSVVSAASETYVIGGPTPSSALRILDCGSHTWRDGPSLKVARKEAVACVHDGKIYVLGGCAKDDEAWGEVFDTKAQAWESLPHPGTEISKHAISLVAEMDEKLILRDVKHNTYGYDPREVNGKAVKS